MSPTCKYVLLFLGKKRTIFLSAPGIPRILSLIGAETCPAFVWHKRHPQPLKGESLVGEHGIGLDAINESMWLVYLVRGWGVYDCSTPLDEALRLSFSSFSINLRLNVGKNLYFKQRGKQAQVPYSDSAL